MTSGEVKMTKKQFCENIINNFCLTENIDRKNLSDHHITMSSSLAVAMEYLGLIKSNDMKMYAASRDGLSTMAIHKKTVREYLKTLEEVD